MKRRKPSAPPREDYTLIEFSGSRISPMRDLIVCCAPGEPVLRGRILDRFAQWWSRKALAVDLVGLEQHEGTFPTATLEVRANGTLIATATATPLDVQLPATRLCPRCGQDSIYELVDVTGRSSRLVAVMTACRRCSWRSSVAEYDLGRTA